MVVASFTNALIAVVQLQSSAVGLLWLMRPRGGLVLLSARDVQVHCAPLE
jgi:hypothetical protein